MLSQACRGLDYAHRNGVVHRDVKPGNLLVSDTQVVKLADFGIARATDQSSITQVGSVLGTAAYLAPEQARGEEAGPRADIYSLGVVAYQLLSGRLPYEASSLSELALKQQREAPPPLDELNPQRRPASSRWPCRWRLAIDQEQRPSDAVAMAEALRSGACGHEPLRRPGHAGAQRGARSRDTARHPGRRPRPAPAPRAPPAWPRPSAKARLRWSASSPAAHREARRPRPTAPRAAARRPRPSAAGAAAGGRCDG